MTRWQTTITRAMQRRMSAARMILARPGRIRVVAVRSALHKVPLTTWAATSALGLSTTAIAVATVLGFSNVVAPQAQAWPQSASGGGISGWGADGSGAPLYGGYPDLSVLPGPLGSSGGQVVGGTGSGRTVGGIPVTVLHAYQHAAGMLAASQPTCHLPVTLLAGIGKVESNHADGGYVDARGTTRAPILGPQLDGSNGTAAIRGADGDWERAEGPMQFLPSTWASWGVDGDNDGTADPANVYDAAAAAGRYLCAAGGDVATPDGLRRAILAYNHSDAYLALVIAWMRAYSGGVVPVADATTPARNAATTGHSSSAPPSGGGDGRPAPPPPTSAPSPPAPSPAPQPSPSPSPPPSPSPGGLLPMPGAGAPTVPSGPPSPTPANAAAVWWSLLTQKGNKPGAGN